jgi:hypothetical protein
MVRLAKENLSDLMQICAGIKFENNATASAGEKKMFRTCTSFVSPIW